MTDGAAMRVFVKLATLGFLLTSALPASAQSGEPIDKRVGQLESQMKAVQRKVFPGGDKRFFEPEFPATDAAAPAAGAPATSPIADLTTRVDALERQLQTLTGQVEQATFKARQNEEAMTKLRADTEFRLGALEGGAKPAPAAVADDEPPVPPAKVTTPAKTSTKPVAKTPPVTVSADAGTTDAMPPSAPKPKAAPPAPTSAEGAFQAAYALYQTKKYDEAETALQAFLTKYPNTPRASHARYWLGRTYMAQHLPAQAAKAYLENYNSLPKGARAPDSLLGLGGALVELKKPEQACEVYGELDAVYAAKLSTDQKAQLTRGRAAAKCKS